MNSYKMDLLNCLACYMLISFLLPFVSPNVLESEQSSFLGLTREVPLSSSTHEQARALRAALLQHAGGDRRVRRYFRAYDTPFAGSGRRHYRDDDAYSGD